MTRDKTNNRWKVILQRLIERREQLNISGYQIADECNVSQSTIKRIFDGDTVPSVEIYLRILEALQLKSIIKNI